MQRFFQCLALAASLAPLFGQETVNLSGIVTDSAGTPIAAAAIRLENAGMTATSGADGRFSITGGTPIRDARPRASISAIRDGSLFLSVPDKSSIRVAVFGLRGEILASLERDLNLGSHALKLPETGTGVRFLKLESGNHVTVVKGFSWNGTLRAAGEGPIPQAILTKAGAAALYDVLTATKTGYQKAYVNLARADSSNITIRMLREGAQRFSFFITSLKVMRELARDTNGFGGDLRFGETGAGAGLRGADKLCAFIAERSLRGSAVKGWRAFLSVTADANGRPVNAIDRIGAGPWYDRLGRLMAPTLNDLKNVRPQNGDPTIQNDLPNEDGVPNHRPDPTKPQEDNHHMLTGSNTSGTLQGASSTCKDWTTSDGSSANGQPMCGFAWPRGSSTTSGAHWMSTFPAPGCARGVDIFGTGGPPPGSNSVGAGGGYGGIYCFALNP